MNHQCFRMLFSPAMAYGLFLVGGSIAMDDVSAPKFPALRVMTYNIHHGEGLDGKLDLDRIAGVIRAANPGIVCLQEVDRNLPRTQRLDFPALLAEKLAMTCVFECNYPFDGGDYGNATLTKLEVLSHENIKLPTPEGIEPRGCLRVTVKDGARTLDVLNAHLGLDEKERGEQTAEIVKALRATPTILAGDMNETATAPGIAAILERLDDTNKNAAPEKNNTSPAQDPKRKIDFIFTSKDMQVLSFETIATPSTAVASDHLPCIAAIK